MWVTTKEWVPMMKNTKKLKYMGQGIQEQSEQNFLKAVFHIFYLVHSWIS